MNATTAKVLVVILIIYIIAAVVIYFTLIKKEDTAEIGALKLLISNTTDVELLKTYKKELSDKMPKGEIIYKYIAVAIPIVSGLFVVAYDQSN